MPRSVQVVSRAKIQLVPNPNVVISAPTWVEQTLQTLAPELTGTVIHFDDKRPDYTIGNAIGLRELVALTRIEQSNVTGVINMSQYQEIEASVVRSLRDLVREVVIVGAVGANCYGGYGGSVQNALNPPHLVFVCDLPGLQFQQPQNTGRLFLIPSDSAALADEQGVPAIDDAIFQAVAGEPKATYAECEQDTSGRYTKVLIYGQDQYFDTVAYRRSIAKDFVKAATMLNAVAESSGVHNLCFKFLQQGMGFFSVTAESYNMGHKILQHHIGHGILDGLKTLTEAGYDFHNIKALELPFFPKGAENDKILSDISALCASKGIAFFGRTEDDALCPRSGYTVATTNCGDPHACAGNEMNYGSVDATIAENLWCTANSLSVFANPYMQAMPMPTVGQQLAAAASTPATAAAPASSDASSVARNPNTMYGSRADATVTDKAAASPAAIDIDAISEWLKAKCKLNDMNFSVVPMQKSGIILVVKGEDKSIERYLTEKNIFFTPIETILESTQIVLMKASTRKLADLVADEAQQAQQATSKA